MFGCPYYFDFGFFYAASSCLLEGYSPYNESCLAHQFQKLTEFGWAGDRFRMPPNALPLIAWTGLMPPLWSAALWAIITAVLLLVCYRRLKEIYDEDTFVFPLFVFSFFPLIKVLYFGQISLLFLWIYLEALRSKEGFQRGLWWSAALMKPNLFFPVAIYGLVTSRRRFEAFWGMVAGAMIQMLFVFILLPSFFSETVDHAVRWGSLEQLLQPTARTFIIKYLAIDVGWWPYFAVLLSSLWFGLRSHRRSEGATNIILLMSFVWTPYMWAHDAVVLLPALLVMLMRLDSLWVPRLLIAANLFYLAGALTNRVNESVYFYFILGYLGLFVVGSLANSRALNE